MKRPTMFAAIGAAIVILIAIVTFALLPRSGNREAATSTRAGSGPGSGLRMVSDPVDARVMADLKKLLRRYQDAVRKKDVEGLMALMTDDVTQDIIGGKTLDRAQIEATLRTSLPQIVSIDQWTLDITELKVRGDIASGTVIEYMRASVRDKTGSATPHDVKAASRNTWVRTPSGWKYRRMQEVPYDEDLGQVQYASGKEWESKSKALRARRDQGARVRRDSGEKPLSQAEARQMLNREYAAFRDAVRRKDMAKAVASLTDNYQTEYPDQIRGRDAVEAGMAEEMKYAVSIPQWRQEIHGITVDGNTVTARLNDRRVTVLKDREGKKHTSTVEVNLLDTWVKTRDGWKNSRTEVLDGRIFLDGKLQGKI